MIIGNLQPLVCSLASCTESGKILEDTADGAAKLVTVISSATANTFGSWAEVDASLAADSWICGISIKVNADTTQFVLELGVGAGGSEVTKFRWSCPSTMAAVDILVFTLPIPIKVAAGARLAARIGDEDAVARAHQIGVNYYQGLET